MIMKNNLIDWYDLSKKNMPWRINTDPYRVWVSEVMLQQTQVTTVIPYYNKWIKKFPSVKSISVAKIDDILKLWEGLGYYRRAHNIKKSCDIIMKDFGGVIPSNKKFKDLPGVGDYIYSAVMSIAFNKAFPVIDGNVKRVGSRLWETDFLDAKSIKVLKSKLLNEISADRPGCFNQAIMDLGREICKPHTPICNQCPVSMFCKAFKNKTVLDYPVKKKTKKVPVFDVVVACIQNHQEKFIITKRPKDKMLGGLWELPGGKREKGETLKNGLAREIREELSVDVKIDKKIGVIQHSYSHMKINLHGYYCRLNSDKIKLNASDRLEWIKFSDIDKFSFPIASHKLFKKMEKY
jgi:A/G-specific adenine glycosylase